jgi:hemerythrin
MTWRPAYCSGHPLLERQHEALFEVANAVLTVAVTGDLEHASRDLIAGHILKEDRESLGAKLPLRTR